MKRTNHKSNGGGTEPGSSLLGDANPPTLPPRTTLATEYADFVIKGVRKNPAEIEVSVLASPAGGTEAMTARFPTAEARRFRERFRAGGGGDGSGAMMISSEEATQIGRRLAEVLFPSSIFRLFAQSLALACRPGGGLRIRLAFESCLMDLPWEYVYRPDRLDHAGECGFLLLDPKISLVRGLANSAISLQPITGQQRLAVVGCLWENGADTWEVRKEFQLLRDALKPVDRLVQPRFLAATDAKAFGTGLAKNTAMFHYAGHCDFDPDGQAYLVREKLAVQPLPETGKVYFDELAPELARSGTRFVVLSACNSGFCKVVEPLLQAGIPAIVGINGGIASISTIEFCSKLYESLAIGLALDEAVGRARLHLFEWGTQHGLFDWGLFMIYMPSPQAVLFARGPSAAIAAKQADVRIDHEKVSAKAIQQARAIDGMNFGEIMSELARRRVLVLGRFTGRRLKVLEAIKAHLAEHPNRYIAELFTYKRPETRDLIESIIGFAALSRFIIADLSEAKSIQSELEAIVPKFLSVPVIPLINKTGKEWATFAALQRKQNVAKPTMRYRDLDDLLAKLDVDVVLKAEAILKDVAIPPSS